jgi:hypothetical protein
MDQAVVGAQAQGFNQVSTGIACLGTFGQDGLPDAAVEALARTIAWKFGVHATPATGSVVVRSRGGEANRHPDGTLVELDRVSGHRDGGRTECPGAALHAQLPKLRERVAAWAPQFAAPFTTASPLTAKAASRRVRAGGSGVLVTGSAAPGAAVEVGVARQDRRRRFRHTRRLRTVARADGTYSLRIRLPTPGLYRLSARSGSQRAPAALVRSVRRTAS